MHDWVRTWGYAGIAVFAVLLGFICILRQEKKRIFHSAQECIPEQCKCTDFLMAAALLYMNPVKMYVDVHSGYVHKWIMLLSGAVFAGSVPLISYFVIRYVRTFRRRPPR